MLPHEIENLKRRLDHIIGDEKLTAKFRERYGTEFKVIYACIDGDLIKPEAVKFIMELTRNEVSPKKTYKATISFEYDGEEPLPLSEKKITHLDDIIDQVRFELDEIPANEFIIEAALYVDGEFNHSIRG